MLELRSFTFFCWLVFEGVQTYRSIAVFENGEIREREWNSKSSFKRQRNILADGEWQITYLDGDGLDCGYMVVYSANGNVFRGERYKGKWHGQLEEIYTDGRRAIGNNFYEKPYGDWRIIEKDGTEKIVKF